MREQKTSGLRIAGFLLVALVSACVEKIEFDIPLAENQTVIEGYISEGPGPHTVKVSSGIALEKDSVYRLPLSGVQVTLHDDQGQTEALVESEPGTYQTQGIIVGEVGHRYFIQVKTSDGKMFESLPDLMNPPGDIDQLRYEYEARTVVEPYGEVAANVFKIFVDAHSAGGNSYTRWRYTGTYEVETYPALHYTNNPPYRPYKNPWPCSGHIILPGPEGSGGLLTQVGECTCCTCWARHYESAPQLSDTQLVEGNTFKNLKVGEVPINNITFHKKYMVEVEQMSLGRVAFDFFKIVREQKENASSLFQPPSGELKGNLFAVGSNSPVVGIFYATAIKTKRLFINKSDLPYLVTPIDYMTLPCQYYPNSTNQMPEGWQ